MYWLQVGQEQTAWNIVEEIATFYGGEKTCSEPVVLLLGGPSGHGKTATGKNIAALLAASPLTSSNMKTIPCASIKTDVELFGSGGAYQNSETRSELNAFLCANVNKRCVVSSYLNT